MAGGREVFLKFRYLFRTTGSTYLPCLHAQVGKRKMVPFLGNDITCARTTWQERIAAHCKGLFFVVSLYCTIYLVLHVDSTNTSTVLGRLVGW